MQTKAVNAVVTGANGSLGQCLVDQLLTRGARKVYATGRDRASLHAVGWADTGRVNPLVLDITDATQARAAAESASDATLVLNNAG